MAIDYTKLAEMSWDAIPDSQIVPTGTWKLQCRSAFYYPPKEEGQDARVQISWIPVEPMDDVDEDRLAAMGDYDLSFTVVDRTWFISDGKVLEDVKKVILLHGVVPETGQQFGDVLKGMRKKQVMANLISKVVKNRDGENKEVNFPTTFAAVQ